MEQVTTVSVIIPTYNRAEFLPECIESVLNQSYKDLEIIVVDDGSTDKTLEVLAKYPTLNVIKTKHVNTAHALNRGIGSSHGLWIKLFGSDDVMFPECMGMFMKCVTNRDCIYYSDYVILKNGKEIPYQAPSFPLNEQYPKLREAFYGGCALLSRQLFYRFGMFDETFPYAEDYDFWLRCVSRGIEMRHLPFYACKFRLHAGQTTKIYDKSFDEAIKKRYENPISKSLT